MLYITIRDWDEPPKDLIHNVSGYFKRLKKKDWFNNDFVKRVIREIDKSEHIKDELIESPVFGGMAPERLSNGAKCLIMLYNMPDINIYGSRMGDNCVPLLLELGEMKDINITLGHIMQLPEEGFTATITNDGRVIHTRRQLIYEFYECRGDGFGLPFPE